MLAGGLGRRFGGIPKGLEQVGGVRMIDRVAAALRSTTREIILAANAAEARTWLDNVFVVVDKRAQSGGLAGVEAALLGGRDVLVVAWDMPFVSTAMLELLLAEAQESNADVVLPDSDSPYGFEPFCAFYSHRVLGALTAFLNAGGGAAREFLRAIERVHRVPIATTQRVGDPSRLFFSVNSREDLERANAMVSTA